MTQPRLFSSHCYFFSCCRKLAVAASKLEMATKWYKLFPIATIANFLAVIADFLADIDNFLAAVVNSSSSC